MLLTFDGLSPAVDFWLLPLGVAGRAETVPRSTETNLISISDSSPQNVLSCPIVAWKRKGLRLSSGSISHNGLIKVF